VTRVLFVAPSAYLVGGMQTWLHWVDEALAARGFETVVGLAAGPVHHRPEAYLRAHAHRRWVEIPTRTCTVAGRRAAVAKAVRAVGPDLVASVNVADVVPAVATLRASRPRVVVTLHGTGADTLGDVRAFAGGIDAVVATNRLGAALAVRVGGLPEERVFRAPPGIRVGPAPPPRAADPDGALRVAWVGRVQQEFKRVLDVPHVARHLRDRGVRFRLDVLGSGADEARLRALVHETSTGASVRLLGARAPEEVRRALLEADVLLCTSDAETGPIVAWEALAAGAAVVTSRYAGLAAEGALRDGENALVYPVGDAASAAAALASLAASPALRERLAREGRRLVESEFASDVAADAWSRALAATLDLPPRPAASFPAPPRAGRLDAVLGARVADALRARTRRAFVSEEPGGEWPHAYSSPVPSQEFREAVAALDVPAPAPRARRGPGAALA
jgi:glycosyltransferase involved in cell wall biosynthesis